MEEEKHSTDDAKVEKDRVSVTMNSDEEEERIVHLKVCILTNFLVGQQRFTLLPFIQYSIRMTVI